MLTINDIQKIVDKKKSADDKYFADDINIILYVFFKKVLKKNNSSLFYVREAKKIYYSAFLTAGSVKEFIEFLEKDDVFFEFILKEEVINEKNKTFKLIVPVNVSLNNWAIIQVTVKLSVAGKKIKVVVSSPSGTGLGIPEDDKNKIIDVLSAKSFLDEIDFFTPLLSHGNNDSITLDSNDDYSSVFVVNDAINLIQGKKIEKMKFNEANLKSKSREIIKSHTKLLINYLDENDSSRLKFLLRNFIPENQSIFQIIKEITFYAGTLTVRNAVIYAADFFHTLMLAKLAGNTLAAYSLVSVVTNTINSSEQSLLQPVSSIVSNNNGKGDYRAAGSVIQQSWLLGGAMAGISIIAVWNVEYFLRLLSNNDELINLAKYYIRPFLFSIPAARWLECDIKFLQGIGKKDALIFFGLGSSLLELGLRYILIFGAFGIPGLGFAGSAYATLIEHWISFMFLKIYLVANPEFKSYELFSPRLVSTFRELGNIIKLGAPFLLYNILLMPSSILRQKLLGSAGVTRLILDQILSANLKIINLYNHGMGTAASIFVSQVAGEKNIFLVALNKINLFTNSELSEVENPIVFDIKNNIKIYHKKLRLYGNSSIVLNSGFSLLSFIVLNSFSRQLASLFATSSQLDEVDGVIRVVFILATLTQIFDNIKSIAGQNLQGLFDNWFVSIVNILITLACVLPLQYILSSVLALDVYGLYAAGLFGGGLASIITTGRWIYKVGDNQLNEEIMIQEGTLDTNKKSCTNFRYFLNKMFFKPATQSAVSDLQSKVSGNLELSEIEPLLITNTNSSNTMTVTK